MGRIPEKEDRAELEDFIRSQNAISSRRLLDMLKFYHGQAAVEESETDRPNPPAPPKPVVMPVPEPEPSPQYLAGVNRIEIIKRLVCDRFKVSKSSIESASRRAGVVRPRQIAMYLARKHTKHSFPEIGRRLGGRDHTTILHAFDKIEHLRHRDRDLANDLEILEASLQ